MKNSSQGLHFLLSNTLRNETEVFNLLNSYRWEDYFVQLKKAEFIDALEVRY